jgi:bifunctional non-homologous end joining protein LigD
MDIFDKKEIKPMLISEMMDPFDSEEFIYEIKWDGIRCVSYLDENGTDMRNKRNKMMIPILPELSELHKQVKVKCILDHELVVLKNGIPEFYEIQKRTLMTKPMKIQLSANRLPASIIAYDILYYKDRDITGLPVTERKKYLEDAVIENNRLIVSRYIETYGIELFNQVKVMGLEGIVAKRKTSTYWQGKRSKDWIKCKVLSTIDCVVCGYIIKEHSMSSLIIGLYDDNILVYKGHVSLGVSISNLIKHGVHKIDYSPFGYIPRGNSNAVWIEPNLVCIVDSMLHEGDAFRQPVFKGFRTDKLPLECQIDH